MRIFLIGSGASIGHSKGKFPGINDIIESAKKESIITDEDGKIRPEYQNLHAFIHKNYGFDIETKKVLLDFEKLFTNIELELGSESNAVNIDVRDRLLSLLVQLFMQLHIKVDKEKTTPAEYSQLIDMLNDKDHIISFNWDILLDNELGRTTYLDELIKESKIVSTHPFVSKQPQKSQYENLCQSFTLNYEGRWLMLDGQYPFQQPHEIGLGHYIKLHGSIDWKYCVNEVCDNHQKVHAVDNPSAEWYCGKCAERERTLIIPPTLYKPIRNFGPIRKGWNLAALIMKSASEINIWGYSLPPTDFYSEWLLRQARHSKELKKINIINPSIVKHSEGLGEDEIDYSFIAKFYLLFYGRISAENIGVFKNFDDFKSDTTIFEKESHLANEKKSFSTALNIFMEKNTTYL